MEGIIMTTQRERENILAYFQQHNIKSITLNGNNLIIEYNNNSQTETKLIDTSELQLIQSYCQKQGLNTLALFDLQKQEPNTQKPFNWTPWIIGGGIAVVIIIGAIIYFLARKKEPKKDYEDWK